MKIKHLFLFLFLLCSMIACQRKEQNILSERQMEHMLYDYHLSQAMASQFPDSVASDSICMLNWCIKSMG